MWKDICHRTQYAEEMLEQIVLNSLRSENRQTEIFRENLTVFLQHLDCIHLYYKFTYQGRRNNVTY